MRSDGARRLALPVHTAERNLLPGSPHRAVLGADYPAVRDVRPGIDIRSPRTRPSGRDGSETLTGITLTLTAAIIGGGRRARS